MSSHAAEADVESGGFVDSTLRDVHLARRHHECALRAMETRPRGIIDERNTGGGSSAIIDALTNLIGGDRTYNLTLDNDIKMIKAIDNGSGDLFGV